MSVGMCSIPGPFNMQGDTMSTVGVIMSTPGGVQYTGGHLEHTRGMP